MFYFTRSSRRSDQATQPESGLETSCSFIEEHVQVASSIQRWLVDSPHVLCEEPPCPPRSEERLHLDGRPLPRHSLLLVRLPGKEAPPSSLDCYGRPVRLRWVLDGSLCQLRCLCCVRSLSFVSSFLVFFIFFFAWRLLLLLLGTRHFAVLGCVEVLMVAVVGVYVVLMAIPMIGRMGALEAGAARGRVHGYEKHVIWIAFRQPRLARTLCLRVSPLFA